MTGLTARPWTRYWPSRADPAHRFDSTEWYAFCAKQLLLLFPEGQVKALELGSYEYRFDAILKKKGATKEVIAGGLPSSA